MSESFIKHTEKQGRFVPLNGTLKAIKIRVILSTTSEKIVSKLEFHIWPKDQLK